MNPERPDSVKTIGQVAPLPATPRREAATVLRLEGEFDLSNVGLLEEAMSEAFAQGSTNLVLDLSRVTFLDATMLNMVVLGHKRSLMRNGSFALVRPCAAAWRPFALTGVDRTLRVFDSLADALERLSAEAAAAAASAVPGRGTRRFRRLHRTG